MNDPTDLDHTLKNLRELMHQYHELALEYLDHHDAKEQRHHLHELKAKLEHLQYLLDESQDNEEEKKKHFLQHHAETIRHALDHQFHINRHIAAHEFNESSEFYAVQEELREVHKQLWHLYEKLRHEKEMEEHLKHQAQATPGPNPYSTGFRLEPDPE